MTIVSPSLLSADFLHLEDDVKMINESDAQWIHLDVMDGTFVPNISFGFPEHTLIGTSPDITRYFIELRGIGIIDVKTLFGVECVKEKQQIDLVIKLEDWKKENEYDRLGLEEEYTEFLGNKVVCHKIPIRPGRNLAIFAVVGVSVDMSG